MSEHTGVVFPVVGDRRSTSATGRAVVADALRAVDPLGATEAERETSWRQGYVQHFRRLVEAGLPRPEDALRIATDGLDSLHGRMRWIGADGVGAEGPLSSVWAEPAEELRTETVQGTGTPETELVLPYHGERLAGDALRRRLDAWVEEGIVEPGLREVVSEVVDHPEWLRLEGTTVAVLGAAAEMGPLRSLLRWGADIAAVDLPRPDLWSRVLQDAERYAGSVRLPTRGREPRTGDLVDRAGGDLLHDLPAVARWIDRLEGPVVLGNYVYADGATNVRVCTAVDALTEWLRHRRDDVSLSFLATPTDVFAVPDDAVAAATAAYATRRTRRALRVPLRALSGGRLLRRNYVPGISPGLNDSVVLQQGPNYLLAKRIQRWRAAVARAEGTPVSLTVAPPTRTRSVVKNRALAAAYAGAHRFGIEVFEPATSNTLMAAVLVHDIRAGKPAQAHPWQGEAYAAAHGGLWRAAYDPRSALGLAALLGVAAAR